MTPTTVLLAKQQPKQMTINGIRGPIHVEIAASIKGDVKLERGIYLFKIYCALESCNIERISINECIQIKNGTSSFRPRVDIWSSWAGFLEANLSGNVLELTVFQGTHHQLPAKVLLTFDRFDQGFMRLISFKASGFINLGAWPDIENRIEYAPLYGDQLKKLDCPVFLPGL
jgi:hypothetical protein